MWDSERYPPAKVRGYPTPLDLEWLDQRRETRRPLLAEPLNTEIAGRGYQIAAIRSVLERVEASRRQCLLVMATGTRVHERLGGLRASEIKVGDGQR
jgi:type I restriction enzyme R subunit